MVIDIHKTIISNPVSRNLLKPWGSFAKEGSLRSKLFNKYTDPGNPIGNKLIFIRIQVKYIKFMTHL